jgi:hypothetical protein
MAIDVMIIAAYGMTVIVVTIATAKRTHQDRIIRKTHLRLIRAEQTTEQTEQKSGCKSVAAPFIVLALMACASVVITKKKN